MSSARLLSALAAAAARRPLLVVGIALALGAGGAALALNLRPSAAADTFVGRSSSDYRATQRYYANFGEEPVDVVVHGNLQQLVLSSDLEQLAGLEGCLAGRVPAKALAQEGGAVGPCGQLARAHTIKVVLGPGTFVNEAATQIAAQLSAQSRQAQLEAQQAERVVRAAALTRGHSAAEATQLGQQASRITLTRYAQEVLTLGLRYGLQAVPSISDPNFVSTLVFDSTGKTPGTPKQRFAYLFPSREEALISVRMRPGLSESQRTRTIALIRQAVAMPQWRLSHGESYLVTGEPAIVADLTGSISHTLLLLLIAVALVMAITLGLVFTGRPRLLPLALAGLACALAFGGLALVGGSLSIAQVAVLPVLVGLAVDYAIQFQSRVGEEGEEEGEEEREGAAHGMPGAVRRAAEAGGPTIALACAASAGGVLALELSPVPMVRGFGLLLVVGLGLAFVCALTVGSAALVLTARRSKRRSVGAGAHGAAEEPGGAKSTPKSPGGALAAGLSSAWHGARELLHENPLTRLVEHAALVVAVRRPGRVLAVGLALAVLGWGLDTQTRVETDITKLVPQNLASLRNLNTLERASGVGGEIDMMVSSKALTKPATIEWMSSYESAVLERYGYSSTRGCGQAQLCPAFSLPDLFGGGAAGSAKSKLTQAQVNALLAVIPPYFSQEVIASGKRVATLAFGIRLMGLAQQQRVIEGMRAALHPPAGVSVQLVGLPVLAAHADAQVASVWRRMLTLLAGLAAVALVLLVGFRGDWRRALAPLLPVALATGWSALIVFLLRVPLNPMSVTLGTLVLAVATEFSVLLSERHRQERIAGRSMVDALRHSYRRTGAAVAASGVTAIAGFGVLALSDIQMLRDFGLVTLVDLSVSLVGVLVALPAALIVVERGVLASLSGGWLAAVRERLPGVARRRRGQARHEPA
ncbi:MAG: MMPL family transporter [Solirubrobacterales bacterium]